MSTFNDIDIECIHCNDTFSGTIWTAVHSVQDPELKDLLLGGELNMVMCPHCSHISYQPHFVLYQDPPAELIAYVYPIEQQEQAAALEAMMLKGFEEAQIVYEKEKHISFKPMLIFGLEALVEMLNEEQSRGEQSQVAQEICKETKLPFAMLSPSQARAIASVRVIPLGGTTSELNRDTALAGLEKLLTINPTLTHYVELQKKITADPHFEFKKSH